MNEQSRLDDQDRLLWGKAEVVDTIKETAFLVVCLAGIAVIAVVVYCL